MRADQTRQTPPSKKSGSAAQRGSIKASPAAAPAHQDQSFAASLPASARPYDLDSSPVSQFDPSSMQSFDAQSVLPSASQALPGRHSERQPLVQKPAAAVADLPALPSSTPHPLPSEPHYTQAHGNLPEVSDALSARVRSAKAALHSATRHEVSQAAGTASLDAFKKLLADIVATRSKPLRPTNLSVGKSAVVTLDDTILPEGSSLSAAASVDSPRNASKPPQAGAPQFSGSLSIALEQHLQRMGVAVGERWDSLHVQSACWGVPLWVLRSAHHLQDDGLPQPSDPLHWVCRLWPILSRLQGQHAWSEADLTLAFLEQLVAAGCTQPPALGAFWAGNRDATSALATLESVDAAACILPHEAYVQLLTAIPAGLSCPDPPMPWSTDISVAQRRTAWAWLQDEMRRAQNSPPNLLSVQRHPPRAPPLGSQEAVVLASLWHPSLPDDTTVAMCRRNPVSKSDLKRLQPRTWLNDELINCRLAMFNEAAANAPARSYVPNLFFLGSLGTGADYNYKSVRRWTKRAKVDVTQLDRAVFPINTANTHWTAAVVDFQRQECVHWDSLCSGVAGVHGDELRSLRRWLADEVQDKHDMQLQHAIQQWPLKSAPPTRAPQQDNGYDCGVFCMQFCTALLCGAEEHLMSCSSQQHVSYLRLWYALAFFAQGPDKTSPRGGKWQKYLIDTEPPTGEPSAVRTAAIFDRDVHQATGAAADAMAAAATSGALQSVEEQCIIMSD